jgi:hypothetical protein
VVIADGYMSNSTRSNVDVSLNDIPRARKESTRDRSSRERPARTHVPYSSAAEGQFVESQKIRDAVHSDKELDPEFYEGTTLNSNRRRVAVTEDNEYATRRGRRKSNKRYKRTGDCEGREQYGRQKYGRQQYGRAKARKKEGTHCNERRERGTRRIQEESRGSRQRGEEWRSEHSMETNGDVRGGKKIKRQSRDIRDRSPDRSRLRGNPEVPDIPESQHRIRETSRRKSPHRSRSKNPHENQHRYGDMRGQPESLQRSSNRGQHESRCRSSDRSHIPGQQENQYRSNDRSRCIGQPENRDRNPGNDRGSYQKNGREHDPQVVAGGSFSKESKRSDKNKKRVDSLDHIASETKSRTPIFGAVKGFFGNPTKHRDPRVSQNQSAKLHKDRPRRGDIQQAVKEIPPLIKEIDEILPAPHPSEDPPEWPKSVLRGGDLQRRPSRAKSRERSVSPEKNMRKEPAAVKTIV